MTSERYGSALVMGRSIMGEELLQQQTAYVVCTLSPEHNYPEENHRLTAPHSVGNAKPMAPVKQDATV